MNENQNTDTKPQETDWTLLEMNIRKMIVMAEWEREQEAYQKLKDESQ
jgi:hypothetical protein